MPLITLRNFVAPVLVLSWMLSLPRPAGVAANPSPSPPRKLVLDKALAEAAQLSRLHSMLVSIRGEIVLEQYFNGTKSTRLAKRDAGGSSEMD